MDYQSWIDALRDRGRKMQSFDTPEDKRKKEAAK